MGQKLQNYTVFKTDIKNSVILVLFIQYYSFISYFELDLI